VSERLLVAVAQDETGAGVFQRERWSKRLDAFLLMWD
jgi:hypothetical protein